MLPKSAERVPAEKLTGDGTPAAMEPVIVPASMPNVTPLALLNTSVPDDTDSVPADTHLMTSVASGVKVIACAEFQCCGWIS